MPEPAQTPRTLDDLLAYVRLRVHETDVNLTEIFAQKAQNIDFRHPSYRLATRDGMATAFQEVELLIERMLLEQRDGPRNGQ